MTMKIAVIGAGVIGLSTAVQLIEKYGNKVDVTIITKDLSPNTTGDISAGLWGPYLCGSTSESKLLEWGELSHKYMHNLWKTGRADEVGISLFPVYRYTDETDNYNAFWKDIVFGFERLTEKEIEQANKEQSMNYKSGVRFLTFTCEPTKWLPYLLKQFLESGCGHLKRQNIETFEELANENYDLIINCAGLNGGHIANDNKLIPIRGQVMRVDASWQFYVVLDDGQSGYYVIANQDCVVLGGTHQENDRNLNVDPNDSEYIRNGTNRMVKSMKNAKIIKEYVGLRPGRESVRLERDVYQTNSNKSLKIIHNYGHGGCGVSFAWGCASDVVNLVNESIYLENNTVCSKL